MLMQRIMNPVEKTDRSAEVETNMAQPQRSSRRDFLRGKAATEAVRDVAADLAGQAGEALGEESYNSADRKDGYLLRFGRRAMACEFEVLLNAGQYPQGPEAALAALDLVDELEAQLTVYRDDSEVSQINRSADLREVEIEPRLFTLFSLAVRMHRETAGAYDITSGPLSKTWGFYRREGRIPADAELVVARERVGLQHVELNSQRSTIRFRKSGMEINLGSIGKGYALDRIAELFESKGIENFLLHGGNSSVLGRGASVDGWWIGLRHPLVPERRIGEILLRDRALGTSGSGTQFFTHEGRRYGHILDPRTGWPAEGMLSVTVAAATGAEADALATAFYVLGVDAALDYCRQHPGIAAILMSPGDSSATVDVTIYGTKDIDLRTYDDPTLSVRWVDS